MTKDEAGAIIKLGKAFTAGMQGQTVEETKEQFKRLNTDIESDFYLAVID